jgi:hypothetical protein
VPLGAAIVPHAPLLVRGVSPDNEEITEDLRRAVELLDLGEVDAFVLISPHGERSGVYGGAEGSLAGFGVSGASLKREVDSRLAVRLRERWGRPALEGTDHGISVPLMLGLLPDVPVVAVTLREVTGAKERALRERQAVSTLPAGRQISQAEQGITETRDGNAMPEAGVAPSDGEAGRAEEFAGMLEDARELGRALAHLGLERSLGVVASVNTGAALTARAPLSERQQARAVERRVLEVLTAHGPAALNGLVRDMWRAAGSCAAGPLVALGAAFPDARVAPLAYDLPFGVGYLVAALE